MNRQLARLEALLAAGWRVEDISSDFGEVEVRLARGAERFPLVLDRDDAAEVLYGERSFPEPMALSLVVER